MDIVGNDIESSTAVKLRGKRANLGGFYRGA